MEFLKLHIYFSARKKAVQKSTVFSFYDSLYCFLNPEIARFLSLQSLCFCHIIVLLQIKHILQGSYIGNTSASQADEAGSTPVPCFCRLKADSLFIRKPKGEIALFQNIVLINANTPENQLESKVSDLNSGIEESDKEKAFDQEGKDFFDVEKIFDNLIHGKLF